MEYFKDETGKIHEYVYLFKEGRTDFPDGWYFMDGTETLNGPFDSLDECEYYLNQWEN